MYFKLKKNLRIIHIVQSYSPNKKENDDTRKFFKNFKIEIFA